MSHQLFDAPLARRAFHALDERLEGPVRLVLGGGTAMLLAHGHPATTSDADVFPAKGTLDDIGPHARAVAVELGVAPDWLNPWFTTFTHVLPNDYASCACSRARTSWSMRSEPKTSS